ncbi:unnamed protein product [Ranitomeya imitator]|uniref:Protein kinase domain-containing protein n=1 Tax=Ranitomeya imitator TaxID=111125 RepID=A0ABN9LVY2_9NEOB|nr:unnamed protein product [Ranitomeya imitator]
MGGHPVGMLSMGKAGLSPRKTCLLLNSAGYKAGGEWESAADIVRDSSCAAVGTRHLTMALILYSVLSIRFYTAEIVWFLYGHNIIHQDIKLENIMLNTNGHIRVIDLGLAHDGVTSSNNIFGVTVTFHFMAPEVLRKKGYGTAVDWWSLGIVVSEMATGRSPFYIGSISKMAYRAITKGKPEIPSWLDADVKHLIKKLLCKNPQHRLGVCGNIREHPFFTTISWEDLVKRRARPPFIPFRPVLENHVLQWLEEKKALLPVTGLSYVLPSWAR